MKHKLLSVICALIAFAPTLGAKEINLEGSSLAQIINSVYKNYETQGALDVVPEGYKIIYEAMQNNEYIFDEAELTQLIPEWQLLYYYYTG